MNTNTTEDKAQEIVDIFFDAGARVSKHHFDTVYSALNIAKEEGIEETGAEMIADLYIARSLMNRPLSLREVQPPEEILQYNWLNTLIAQLSDKHKVKYEDIKKALPPIKLTSI